MRIIKTEIPEVIIIEPVVFYDERGYFMESFSDERFKREVKNITFIQDNESKSAYGVLRGLHYQIPPYAQSKLVRVLQGRALDVAVDIRKGSPTFLKHIALELSEENKRQIFIPRGFAHGFVVLSKTAVFAYKIDNKYAPECEASIMYNCSELGIDWRINYNDILLSAKDRELPDIQDAVLFDYNENLY
jgi:dTDP-4-dehydrorhamnose 3,5-epimerase